LKIEDIANLTGVSKSAVSLALNGKPGVSPETRERILQVSEQLGYTSRKRSGSAKDAAPGTITFLVFASSGLVEDHYYQQPFFRELLHHIEERCRNRGYTLRFATASADSILSDARHFESDQSSEGVIVLGTNLNRSQAADVLRMLGPHVVVLDNCFDTVDASFVQINNMLGAYQAGEHLYELGHRQIGYIASDARIHNFDERRNGFIYALKERGIEIGEERTFVVAPTILSSQESLKTQLADYLRNGGVMPTALFCECDYIAISAIKTLSELGYRVPEQVSVVGFDNIAEAQVVTPELTTVHVEKERLAHLAVDLLVDNLKQERSVRLKVTVDTRLVVRQSSAPPANGTE
jgi:LacI family transcriptional regulator